MGSKSHQRRSWFETPVTGAAVRRIGSKQSQPFFVSLAETV